MRWIVVGLLFLGIGMCVNAQALETGGIDTLTAGSATIYEVTPDPNMVNDVNMNASHFNWFFTDITDNPISVPGGGITLTESPDISTGYYAENTINVVYDGGIFPSGTNLKIKIAEVSQPIYGSGCMGNIQELRIHFVNPPTVNMATGSIGSCGFGEADIPLSVNGYGPFVVTFTIAYNSGSPVTYTQTIGSLSTKGSSSVFLTVNSTDHIRYGYGRYDIQITNISDRFSRKAQNTINGTAISGTYTIGVNPTPETQPIQHIRNL